MHLPVSSRDGWSTRRDKHRDSVNPATVLFRPVVDRGLRMARGSDKRMLRNKMLRRRTATLGRIARTCTV